MSKRRTRSFRIGTAVVAPVVVLIVIVAILQFLTVTLNINEHVLPQPINVLKDTIREFPNILPHFLFTLKIVMLGFLISVPLGMIFAALFSQSRVLTNAMSPVILCLVITPMMTLIPIMLLWLGTDPNLRLLVIIVQATPVITLNTLNGFSNVEKEKLELATSVGANKLQAFMKINFMNAMPQVLLVSSLVVSIRRLEQLARTLLAAKLVWVLALFIITSLVQLPFPMDVSY